MQGGFVAIQALMEAGTENLRNEDYVSEVITHVNEKHDRAEHQKKILFVSREFEIAIWECAADLAMVGYSDILAYIQTEMYWFASPYMSYKRVRQLLDSCISECNEDYLDIFDRMGCTDEEIEQLGYGYLLEMEDEND